MNQIIDQDFQNKGIIMDAHYEYYLHPNVVVIDLLGVSPLKSKSDVFRVLLQFAEELHDNEYGKIVLAHRGKVKYFLEGSYFNILGREYGVQDPTNTMRTFPENLFLPSGSNAFTGWQGGLSGVLERQMDDFSEFHNNWYITDMNLKR